MYFMQQNTMKTIKVLLVDDEQDLTSTLSKRLNRMSIDASTASDGTEAFAMLENEHYDVVVLDINMPGINGLQILKAIKQNFPKIEVIMLTGAGGIREARQALQANAFDFLFKPTRFEKLTERIIKATFKPGANHPTSAVA